jgi:hypothetical protein
MKQQKYIRCIWGSRENIREIRILRIISNTRATALRLIIIINDSIPSSLNRASEIHRKDG